MAPSKDRISYFYDAEVGTSYYGNNHPMKPHRIAMTHHLVLSYDLHKRMEVYVRHTSSCPSPLDPACHASRSSPHVRRVSCVAFHRVRFECGAHERL